MTHWRAIILAVLVAAYFFAAYGNSLRVSMPPSCFGTPAYQNSFDQKAGPHHHNWAPKRHIPVAKVQTVDPHMTNGREIPADHISPGLRGRIDQIYSDSLRLDLFLSGRAPPSL